MATTASNITYNTDVEGIVRRLNRFIVEIVKSVSSNVSGTNTFDIARAKSYISAMRAYAAWVVGQPALDLPETAPRATTLPASPEIPDMENDSMYDLAQIGRLLKVGYCRKRHNYKLLHRSH